MKDGFIFYQSFYEAARGLDPETRLSFYDALTAYALGGWEPEIEDPVANALFCMAKPQLDANEKRRENGGKGGRPAKEKPMVFENEENEKPMVSEIDENEKPKEKVKEKVKDKEKEKEKVKEKDKERGARFTPPTPQEVRAYCQERVREGRPAVNPEAFMAFYEANGWRVGKNPMKDWKAAVRTWEQRDKPAREPPKKAYQITGREYDIAALEAQILGRQR